MFLNLFDYQFLWVGVLIFSEDYFVNMSFLYRYFRTPNFVNLIHKFVKDQIEKIQILKHKVTQ